MAGLKLVLLILTTAEFVSAYRRVCYYTNWSINRKATPAKFAPENIDTNLCTHLIFSFAKLNGTQLAPTESDDESTPTKKGLYERFTDLKKLNTNLTMMISVGGWTMASAPFTKMVATSASRQEFAASTVEFLRRHNFDGLDIDWEYPAARGSPAGDKQRYVEMLQVVREQFENDARSSGKPRLILSAATPSSKTSADNGYDYKKIARYLDMINLMTYDFHGTWESYAGHHTPLHKDRSETGSVAFLNVEWAANHYVQNGVPPSMINIGMTLYGKSYTLRDPALHELGDPIRGPGPAGRYIGVKGTLAYYEICKLLASGGVRHEIVDQKVPYIVKDSEWVCYDDQKSLKAKVDFVKQHQLGGIMVWSLDLDDFTGSCGEGKYPLLTAINDELDNTTSGTTVPVITTIPTLVTTKQPTSFPTTNAPPTSMPSTNAPTTQAPATNAPTTQAPATNAPTTQAPITNAPTTVTKAQTTSTTTNPSSKLDCTTNPRGFYLDPTTCKSYTICAGALSFTVRCENGLLFNTKIQRCDSPINVQCNAQQTSGTTTFSKTSAPMTNAPTTNAATTSAMKTTAPLTQAPVTNSPSSQVPVTNAPTTQVLVTNAPTTQAPMTNAPITQAPMTNAPTTQAAITTASISTTKFQTTSTTTDPSSKLDCTTNPRGFYLDPTTCKSYTICAGALSFTVRCDNGLLFNTKIQRCDSPINVQCNMQQTSGTTTFAKSSTKVSSSALTTLAPTTNAPKTQAPISNAPMTNAPTTQAQVTNAPTTQAPMTNAPTTMAPITNALTTQALMTNAPTTQAPMTNAPTTQAPITNAPTTQAPVTNAPTTQVPMTNVPTTQVPVTNAPTTQAPVTNAPTTQVPVTNAPTTQAPMTNAPTTTTKAQTTTVDLTNFCQSHSNGFHANPESCGSFFLCNAGQTFLEMCNFGTVYSPTLQSCDYPSHVKGCEQYYNTG